MEIYLLIAFALVIIFFIVKLSIRKNIKDFKITFNFINEFKIEASFYEKR